MLRLFLACYLAILIIPIHAQIYKSPNTMFHVDTLENIILYDITDCSIDLICGQMPSTDDENIIFCAAAAFTGKCLDFFIHSNILGPHVSKGIRYEGYTENKDGIPFTQRYALFVWNGIDKNGNKLEKGFYHLPNDKVLENATINTGMAFTQHWVIKDSHAYEFPIQPLERIEHFRALCQKGDRYYVIANREETTYQEYINILMAYGVENAIYMDMGTGWNHSFYRDSMNNLHIIHPKTHSYPTNWLVVYKK